MTYHSGQSQPNYKFFCSYGSSKKSELKPKNDYKKEKLLTKKMKIIFPH